MIRRTTRFILALPLLAAVATAVPGAARADDIGDEAAADFGLMRSALESCCKVELRAESDGAWKGSRVWVAESGAGLYVLSSKSAWYQRAKANPYVILRVGDKDYSVAARAVEDDVLRGAVHQALKEKCGFFWYRVRSFFTFWRSNKVMKIVPRPRGH